jgi:hypothetical protein
MCDRTVVFSWYSIQHYVIKFVSDVPQDGGVLLVLYTTLCDKVCQWRAAGRTVVFSWYSTTLFDKVCQWRTPDTHDIAEILLKGGLNTITRTLCFLPETNGLIDCCLMSSEQCFTYIKNESNGLKFMLPVERGFNKVCKFGLVTDHTMHFIFKSSSELMLYVFILRL